jgi:hypothetical protein
MMREEQFFSSEFVLTCPVWLLVNLKQWGKGNETADALLLFKGSPGLGPFLPIFLDSATADKIARELDLADSGAINIESVDQLCAIISLLKEINPMVQNAAVYFKKDKTRFYRFEDLQEELRSYRAN